MAREGSETAAQGEGSLWQDKPVLDKFERLVGPAALSPAIHTYSKVRPFRSCAPGRPNFDEFRSSPEKKIAKLGPGPMCVCEPGRQKLHS